MDEIIKTSFEVSSIIDDDNHNYKPKELELIKALNEKTHSNIQKLEAFGKSLPVIDIADADKVDFAQVHLEVKHHFSLGIYARELYIPKNSVIVGKLHKYPQLNILVKGHLLLESDGEVKAPFIVSSPGGVQRTAYALEDSIWITVHGTDETDIDKIEQHFIAQSKEEYLKFIEENERQLRLSL